MLGLLGRIVLFLVFAYGTLIGVVYPWVAQNQTGYEIGAWEVYSPTNGFAEVELSVPDGGDVLKVRLDVQTSAQATTPDDVAIDMLVRSGTTTVQAEGFRLDSVSAEELDAGIYRYVVTSDQIIVLPGEKTYRISFTQGSSPIPLVAARMTVIGGLFDYDAAVPPLGWALMAVAGLSWAFTRRRKPRPPAVPQWGRGERP